MFCGIEANGKRTLSRDALKGCDYFCPECASKLVFKHGRAVWPHFAHYRRPENCTSAYESALHHEMKLAVYQCLERIWPRTVQLEYPRGTGRADVWVETSPRLRVAVECQVTRLDSNTLMSKLINYRNVGDAVLMIVPWECIRYWEDGIYQVDSWLKYLHTLNRARIYVYRWNLVFPLRLFDDVGRKSLRSIFMGEAVQWYQLSSMQAGDKGTLRLPGLRMAHFGEGKFWERTEQPIEPARF